MKHAVILPLPVQGLGVLPGGVQQTLHALNVPVQGLHLVGQLAALLQLALLHQLGRLVGQFLLLAAQVHDFLHKVHLL